MFTYAKQLVCFGIMLIAQFSFAVSPYSLIFVHLGKSIPAYTLVALRQARLFNPECKIYLIANREALVSPPFAIKDCDVTPVCCETLKKTPAHQKFIKISRLDTSFSEGFWWNTTERFFYLEELMRRDNLSYVFHLENDIMLYVNLGELLNTFIRYYPGIGVTFPSDNLCVPGFVYIHSIQAMSKLTSFLADCAQSGHNDGETLAQFKDCNNASCMEYLPIVPPEYAKKYPLKSIMGLTARNPQRFSVHLEAFDSLFDAAPFGQYLGGLSPRNDSAVSSHINPYSVFNPAFFEVVWEKDDQGRKIPYVLFGDRKLRLNNLHIHSKKLQEFRS